MTSKLAHEISRYIITVITGFEIGMYRILLSDSNKKTNDKQNSGNLSALKSNNQPFLSYFIECHEMYHTDIYNKAANNTLNQKIIEYLNILQTITNHSKGCIIYILANIATTVHFQINRNTLICCSEKQYTESLELAILEQFNMLDIDSMFKHKCVGDDNLKPLAPGEKLIVIHCELPNKDETRVDDDEIC